MSENSEPIVIKRRDSIDSTGNNGSRPSSSHFDNLDENFDFFGGRLSKNQGSVCLFKITAFCHRYYK